MRVFYADYFDGITARALRVEVALGERHLSFQHEGQEESFLIAAIRPQPALGHARRIIELPDGGRLETEDVDAFNALRLPAGDRFWRIMHYVESHLVWATVALLLTIVAGWCMLRFGVPAVATHVAKVTPLSMEVKLGDQVLNGMDYRNAYFSPSSVPPQRQSQLRTSLAQYCALQIACPTYRLEFRKGGSLIGANAMALPGGIVVVTDELLALAKRDEEIIAVLAHELGHVQRRHAFRQSLQGALAGLVLVALTGDLDTLASGLPAVLLQMQYSREMENEADRYALGFLQRACLPPQAFADILSRLQSKAGNSQIPEIVSSHPDTAARVQPFTSARQVCQ